MSDANEMVTVELWVLVDENGDYEVSKDAGDLRADAGLASRMIRLTLQVPQPATVELEATIADEPDTAELKAV